jgi:hypothetical protein
MIFSGPPAEVVDTAQTPRRVVIAGSASMQSRISRWRRRFETGGFEVTDYPRYIGPEAFADCAFAVAHNLLENRNTQVIVLKEPSPSVACRAEIVRWQALVWLRYLAETSPCFVP